MEACNRRAVFAVGLQSVWNRLVCVRLACSRWVCIGMKSASSNRLQSSIRTDQRNRTFGGSAALDEETPKNKHRRSTSHFDYPKFGFRTIRFSDSINRRRLEQMSNLVNKHCLWVIWVILIAPLYPLSSMSLLVLSWRNSAGEKFGSSSNWFCEIRKSYDDRCVHHSKQVEKLKLR